VSTPVEDYRYTIVQEKVRQWLQVRTARGSLNLKPYSTTSCNVNVIVTHDENAVGLVGSILPPEGSVYFATRMGQQKAW